MRRIIICGTGLSSFDLRLIDALKYLDEQTEIIPINESITGTNPIRAIFDNAPIVDQASYFRNRDDPWRGNGKRRSRRMK